MQLQFGVVNSQALIGCGAACHEDVIGVFYLSSMPPSHHLMFYFHNKTILFASQYLPQLTPWLLYFSLQIYCNC